MALRINLTHEIAQAERARKRDPLKISILGLCVIAACFAAYYFLQLAKMSSIAQEYARKKAEHGALDPKAKAAKAREDELSETMRSSDTIVRRIEGRFYWAPLVEQLVTAVPRDVQITRFAGDVQGDGVKKCRLTIDGLSAGEDPRRVAEELRTSIAEALGKKYKNVTSSFRSLEDGVDTAQLDGKTSPTATFAINVEFRAGEDQTAPAAPRTPKKK
jgi:hypothetical protein